MAIEEIHLYQLQAMDLECYLPAKDCGKCQGKKCGTQAEMILAGTAKAAECPYMSKLLVDTIDSIASLKISLSESDPMLTKSGERLVEFNSPDGESPILITADSSITVPILKRIFTVTKVKAYLVPVETGGYTLDNAVAENTFTPMAVMRALMESGVSSKSSNREIVIPGLARSLDKNIERTTKYRVEAGPKSGFELPIWLASRL
jgi:CO dehydrogenase/acetyl-CoA synthase gamma subunit (corrinoid Fe-S protein)